MWEGLSRLHGEAGVWHGPERLARWILTLGLEWIPWSKKSQRKDFSYFTVQHLLTLTNIIELCECEYSGSSDSHHSPHFSAPARAVQTSGSHSESLPSVWHCASLSSTDEFFWIAISWLLLLTIGRLTHFYFLNSLPTWFLWHHSPCLCPPLWLLTHTILWTFLQHSCV